MNSKAVKPVTSSLGGTYTDGREMTDYLSSLDADIHVIDGEKICEEIGSPKVLNIVLLAAAAKSGALGITADELKNAIEKRVNPKFLEMNFKAVDIA